MSLVSLRFICLTHPPCLHSAFEMLLCVFVTLTCAGVCVCIWWTHCCSLHLTLYGVCEHNDAHCIDFFSCHFIIMSPLFLFALSPAFSLLSCFSYLPPLSSVFLIPSPWSIFMPHCAHACYLSPFSFFLFDLNFLISSHLRHSAWFRFAPPSLFSLTVAIASLFCSSVYVFFFSHMPFQFFLITNSAVSLILCYFLSSTFSNLSLFVSCSLSGVHSIFALAWRSRTTQPATFPTSSMWSPDFFLDQSQLSISRLWSSTSKTNQTGKKTCFIPSHSWETPTSSDSKFPHSPNDFSQLPGIWPTVSITGTSSPGSSHLCSRSSTEPLTL